MQNDWMYIHTYMMLRKNSAKFVTCTYIIYLLCLISTYVCRMIECRYIDAWQVSKVRIKVKNAYASSFVQNVKKVSPDWLIDWWIEFWKKLDCKKHWKKASILRLLYGGNWKHRGNQTHDQGCQMGYFQT
jgi:hypothetical protein